MLRSLLAQPTIMWGRICRTVFVLTATFLGGTAIAQEILQVNNDLLTDYKPIAATAVQGISPTYWQRGVQMDGAYASRPLTRLDLDGNPFETAGAGGRRHQEVDLVTGSFSPSKVDIALPAPGFSWVIGRTYNSQQHDSNGTWRASAGPQGRNWFQTSMPELIQVEADGTAPDENREAGDIIYLVYGADRFVEFVRTEQDGWVFKATNGANAMIFVERNDDAVDLIELTDAQGLKLTFWELNDSYQSAGAASGQLWKIELDGVATAFVGHETEQGIALSDTDAQRGYEPSGAIRRAVDSAGRVYRYTYSDTASVLPSVLTSVVVSDSSAPLAEGICRVDYSYDYSSGNLELVEITTAMTQDEVTSSTYEYYQYTDTASDGLIEMCLMPEGARRFDLEEGDSEIDQGYLTASDSALEPYAALRFTYDSNKRVASASADGLCGCSGQGAGEHTYTYESSGHTFDKTAYELQWARRVTVKRPESESLPQPGNGDETYYVYYFDETGQPLHRVVTDKYPGGTGYGHWSTKVVRDSSGRVSSIHTPASITDYTHTPPSSVALVESDTDGLVNWYVRYTTGEYTGFVMDEEYSQGSAGAKESLNRTAYTNLEVQMHADSILRPLVSEYEVWPTANPSITNKTTYAYVSTGQYAATAYDTLTIGMLVETLPAVSTGNNGSGTSDVVKSFYSRLGEKILQRDQAGTIDLWRYSDGQMVLQVLDAASQYGGAGEPFEGIAFVQYGGEVPDDFQSTGLASDHIRLTSSYFYDKLGRIGGKVHPDGGMSSIHYSRLNELSDARTVVLVMAKRQPLYPFSPMGPSPYRVYDHAGREVLSALVGIASEAPYPYVGLAGEGLIDETEADPLFAINGALNAASVRKVERLTTIVTDESGSRVLAERRYFDIPGTATALPGSTSLYDETTFAYDDVGRLIRVEDPTGTVDRHVWDQRDRLVSISTGTDDSDDYNGDIGGTNNMTVVLEGIFDGGSAGGNSFLTKRRVFTSDGGMADDVRETSYVRDVRGLVLTEQSEDAPYPMLAYDNLGRPTALGLYSSLPSPPSDPGSDDTNRLRLEQVEYDEMGRTVRSWSEEIEQDTGNIVPGGDLLTQYWFDERGRVAKLHGSELRKYRYDRLDRLTHTFDLGRDDDDSYATALHQSGDVVLEERQWVYDRTLGAVVLEATIQRDHRDTTTLGALDKNQDGDPLVYDRNYLGTDTVSGRIQIVAHWYDQFTRRTSTAEFGTNQGETFKRVHLTGPHSTAPLSGAGERLVTTYEYGTDGSLLEKTDSEGRVARFEVDNQGRILKRIRNYVGLYPQADQNQTVTYGYSGGLLVSEVYEEPDFDDQVTGYAYGIAKGSGAYDSRISSNRLLSSITHPDDQGGATDNVETFEYNAQKQLVLSIDQAGNKHQYAHDQLGRLTEISLPTIVAGYDGQVQLIRTTYDSLGRRASVGQYSTTTGASADLLDLVGMSYDDWGLLDGFDQSIDKEVGASGPLVEHAVGYTWERADGVMAGGSEHRRETLRLKQLDYAGDGAGGFADTKLTFSYRDTGGLFDDSASRVTAMKRNGSAITQYEYLGVDSLVSKKYLEVNVASRYYDPSVTTGNHYEGLDQYGRVTRSKWTKDLTSSYLDFYDVKIGWNKNSSVEWEDDQVLVGHDADYDIDELERITKAQYGVAISSTDDAITSEVLRYEWSYDRLGNWRFSERDLTGSHKWNGATDLDEERTFTKANEITGRDTDDDGSNDHVPVYDSVGNLIDDEAQYEYEYDPFGNIRFVRNQSQQLVAEYRYNGLGYMISARYDVDGDGVIDGDQADTEYYVYDAEWRLLATYLADEDYLTDEFIHNRAGLIGMSTSSELDDVAVWDRNPDKDGYALDDRHYLCHNWRNDVVVVLDDEGKVWERIKYKAYGVPFCMPAGDMNCDGEATTGGGVDTDQRTMTDIADGYEPYDVLADLDLNGAVTRGSDVAHMVLMTSSQNGGLRVASGVGSRFGYAGYLRSPGQNDGVWLARRRLLYSEHGAWTSRDPLGFVSGGSLYEYVGSRPVPFLDPFGLLQESGGSVGFWGGVVEFGRGAWDQTKEVAIGAYCGVVEGVGMVFTVPYDLLENGMYQLGSNMPFEMRATNALVAQVDAGQDQIREDWGVDGRNSAVGDVARFAGSVAGLAAGEKLLVEATSALSGGRAAAGAQAAESGIAGGRITGYNPAKNHHALERAIGEGAPAKGVRSGVKPKSILDAVKNPTKVTQQANGATRYDGREATVVVDMWGKIVTMWPRCGEGIR